MLTRVTEVLVIPKKFGCEYIFCIVYIYILHSRYSYNNILAEYSEVIYTVLYSKIEMRVRV